VEVSFAPPSPLIKLPSRLGNAEDFSWVVPVPDTPEISIGAESTFDELDFSTRPLFALGQEGQVCPADQINLAEADGGIPTSAPAGSDGGGVVIEEELEVGPFDVQVISSDTPDQMAIWLQDNGYLLTDRGSELLQPYVLAGMKFVALKLRSGESAGSIQPLIMKYPSTKPMVPIRLTAVAAEDDMGVLVWVVNNARAIPENYEHVIPNYARLNWFAGPGNTYGSYQSLITAAMNEADSGQGFATDYAGPIDEAIAGALSDPRTVEATLAELDLLTRDAEYLVESVFRSLSPGNALARLQSILPLPADADQFAYSDANRLEAIFTPTELRDARVAMRASTVERELEPLRNSVNLLPENSYLTRLYTTLSADEMSADPTFNYNSSMPEQRREREAMLRASCENGVSRWDLTLGAGTGREGEVVIEVMGQPLPFVGAPIPVPLADQPAAFERQRTSADAEPESLFVARLPTVMVAADGSVSETDAPVVIPTS